MSSPIYSHNPHDGGDFPLLVLDVASQVCTPSNEGFRVLHWHEEVQFIFVLQGVIHTQVYDEGLDLCAGECLFINRMVPHKTTEKEDCRYHSFLIPERMLSFFPGSIMEKRDVHAILYHPGFTHFLLKEENHAAVLRAVRTLDDRYFAFDSQSASARQGSVSGKCTDAPSSPIKKEPRREYALSVALVSLWQEFLDVLPELPANAPTREYARIREMLSFLHTYYKEEISVTEIAAAAHISKTECLRCFHRFVGEPPYQYLIKYRLHMSTALLTDTNHPVTQIASDTGFPSASTYIRYFRKWHGCTPGEYRRTHATGNFTQHR